MFGVSLRKIFSPSLDLPLLSVDVMLFFSGQLDACSLFCCVNYLPSVKGNPMLVHDPACGGAVFHCPQVIVGLSTNAK